MSMEYVRGVYKVPAKRGGRVRYMDHALGTITSATGSGHLRIKMDGIGRAGIFHPTWKLEYLDDTAASDVPERDAEYNSRTLESSLLHLPKSVLASPVD